MVFVVCVLTFFCVMNTILNIDLYSKLGDMQATRINNKVRSYRADWK